MMLKASKGPRQLSNDGHSTSVLLWKDEAKQWQSEPIEAYCSTAIASVSHFIACSATAGGHHAFACLTRALEIEEWLSRLTPKVVPVVTSLSRMYTGRI